MRTTIGMQLIFPNQFMATSTHVHHRWRPPLSNRCWRRTDVDWTSEIDGSVAAPELWRVAISTTQFYGRVQR